MQNPRNLLVYAKAKSLAAEAYQLTAGFPSQERFGLISQVRRAAVSIGANIAEGCGRSGNRALCAFLYNAMGSASELEFHLELAIELHFCDEERAAPLRAHVAETKSMLSRLLVRLRARPDRAITAGR